MKFLFDFLPILLFFIAYKFFGIYIATGVAMAAITAQVSIHWFKHKCFEVLHLVTMGLVLALGAATLFLHNELYIKWKPTAIYWVFALAFLTSQFVGKKLLIQRMMDDKLNLPATIWKRLNISWVVFFLAMGFVNLYIVYHFNTNTWVNFKLFGILFLTLGFVLAQSLYMARHILPAVDDSKLKRI